jgi:predicted ATPase
VLDNFEHVLEAAPLVTTVLVSCPHVRVLVTSREALRLQGEQQFPVPSLTLPDLTIPVPPDRLDTYSAIRLFVERARAVRPDFALSPANAADVARICALLDGLPLALELAAARIDFLPPAALLSQLARPLDVLTDGARDLPARQRTWRAAVVWSYDLLSPAEQALFRRLAVFAGGCSLAAVVAVCGDTPAVDGPPSPDLLAGLRSLVAKNLLLVDAEGTGEGAAHQALSEQMRFIMLSTVREVGWEQLAAAGEAAGTQRRHALHYLAFAEEVRPKLVGADQLVWLDRVDRDLDNLRAAFRWCLDRGRLGDEEAIERGLGAAGALSYYWGLRGGSRQGRDLLVELLQLPARCRPTAGRARALRTAATLSAVCSDFIAWRGLTGEGVAMAREMGDRLGVARTRLNSGTVLAFVPALVVHDLNGFRADLEEALRLFEESGYEREVGAALVALAHLALRDGDLTKAEAWITRAMPVCEKLGDRQFMARARHALGEIAIGRGDVSTAQHQFVRALELYRHLRADHGAGKALGFLGDIAHAGGDRDAARAYYRESLGALRDTGDISRCIRPLLGLALLAAEAGKADRALRLVTAIAHLCAAAGVPNTVRPDEISLLRAMVPRLSGADELAATWPEGEPATLEAVVDYALASDVA